LSCPDSFTAVFLGAAMIIPDKESGEALSSPTQTALKGLRVPLKASLYCTAMRCEIFAIDFAVF
jgi:hypothetical protein